MPTLRTRPAHTRTDRPRKLSETNVPPWGLPDKMSASEGGRQGKADIHSVYFIGATFVRDSVEISEKLRDSIMVPREKQGPARCNLQ